MVSQIQSGILIASYTYDSQNRMTAATTYGISGTLTETYNYDALGNRIAKTTDGVKTEYVIDYSTGYAQVLRATTDAGTVLYTRGFELISRKDATRELWYLTDGGGSVRYLTDSTGSVTDSLVFDAFGNTVSRAGQTGDSYGFQGEQQDATGLYYLRARYMNPATGSFTQMDTYGGSLSDPMSLHKYLFANANPVKYRDPSGHAVSLIEEQLCVAIISVLGAGYEANIYADNYFDQVHQGKKFDWGEYTGGLWNAAKHGVAIALGSIICVIMASIFTLSVVSWVLLALIMGTLGLLSLSVASILDSANNSQGAEIAKYIAELSFATGGAFLGAAGSAAGASAEGSGIKPEKYSDKEARQWYLYKESQIPNMIDNNLSLEEQAIQAFNLRNQFRTQARDLVLDRDQAVLLAITEPNLTWEQIVQKQVNAGLSGDDIYIAIIESSQRSRTSVNVSVGLI